MNKYLLLIGLIWSWGVLSVGATDSGIACTKEYAPVCGSVQVQCVNTPCNPVRETFGNTCMANAAMATNITPGACSQIVWGDKDEHGCKGSAGYAWDETMKSCIRPWEKSGNLVTWAYGSWLTQYNTVEKFWFNRIISRQEAAAIFARLGSQDSFSHLRYASFPDECNVRYQDENQFDASLKNDIYSACALGMMRGSHGKFSPLSALSRAEALAVVMRAYEGERQDESGSIWYQKYLDKAREEWILNLSETENFSALITRGELIEWLYAASIYVESWVKKNPLIGNWTLDSMDGKTVAMSGITLQFTKKSFHAKICNNINGSYSVGDSVITTGPAMSTLMYCEGLMDIESNFDLSGALWKIENNRLSISTKKNHTFLWKLP